MGSSILSSVKPRNASKSVSKISKPEKSVLSPILKNNNQKIIFETLRELGAATRAEIVDRIGIPRTTVFDALTKLVTMGWVTRSTISPGKGKKGRSKAVYSIHANPSPFSSLNEGVSRSIPLGIFIATFIDIGPVPLVSEGMDILHKNEEGIETFLKRQSIYIHVALGQGDTPMRGLFGPLPVRGHPELLAFAYGFYATDKNLTDPRLQERSFGVLSLILEKKNEETLPRRVELEKTLDRLFSSVKDTEDIDRMLLLTVDMLIQREINHLQ